MHDRAVLERLLRRDMLVVSSAIGLITLLAWWYIVGLAADMAMGGMDMTGMRMASNGLRMVMAPAAKPWTASEFVLMFLMWTVMMTGMMTPSAAPARPASSARRRCECLPDTRGNAAPTATAPGTRGHCD